MGWVTRGVPGEEAQGVEHAAAAQPLDGRGDGVRGQAVEETMEVEHPPLLQDGQQAQVQLEGGLLGQDGLRHLYSDTAVQGHISTMTHQYSDTSVRGRNALASGTLAFVILEVSTLGPLFSDTAGTRHRAGTHQSRGTKHLHSIQLGISS